jgi:hypothetical protein
MPPAAAPADTGSLQGDLEAMVQLQLQRLGGSGLPRIVPRVLAESAEDPDLLDEIIRRAVAPIRAMLAEMVQHGIDRGELREDLDVEAVVDLLHAVPVYKLLMTGGEMESIRDAPARMVPTLLAGLSSSSAGPRSARRRS